MQEFSDKAAPYQIGFECYGMELRICTSSPDLLEEILPMMPPGWRRRPRASVGHTLGLLEEGDDIYGVYHNGMCIHDKPGRRYALMVIERQIQAQVAFEATDFVFLHAGVVTDGERAIVIPGLSFSGKTTLVRALLEKGAIYYSDEFAVLDEAGRVHPYPKRLSLRAVDDGRALSETHAEQLGGRVGEHPVPIGLAVLAPYTPGAAWSPRQLSMGAGALALFEHAVPAQSRPEQTMRFLRAALKGAVVLQGERGEADEFAQILLDTMKTAA